MNKPASPEAYVTQTDAAPAATTQTDAPEPEIHAAARELLAGGNSLRWNHLEHELLLHAGIGPEPAASRPCMLLEDGAASMLVRTEQQRGIWPADRIHWQDHEPAAQPLAWTLANETLLASLNDLFGKSLVARSTLAQGGRNHIWLALHLTTSAGGRLTGMLGIGAAEARELAALAQWQDDPQWNPWLGDAGNVHVHLWLPGPLLDADELAATEPGDVLLVPAGGTAEVRPAANLQTAMLGLPPAWPAHWHDGAWRCAPAELLQAPEPEPRIGFRLDGCSIPARSLRDITPGAVFLRAQLQTGRVVRILVGERSFGRGMTVALGAQLGVRVLSRES